MSKTAQKMHFLQEWFSVFDKLKNGPSERKKLLFEIDYIGCQK
jgi:hypothetical protein